MIAEIFRTEKTVVEKRLFISLFSQYSLQKLTRQSPRMISETEHSRKQICEISKKSLLFSAIWWILSRLELFSSYREVHFNRLYDLFWWLRKESAEHIAFLLFFQYFEVQKLIIIDVFFRFQEGERHCGRWALSCTLCITSCEIVLSLLLCQHSSVWLIRTHCLGLL